jgi:hypothetical protein
MTIQQNKCVINKHFSKQIFQGIKARAHIIIIIIIIISRGTSKYDYEGTGMKKERSNEWKFCKLYSVLKL